MCAACLHGETHDWNQAWAQTLADRALDLGLGSVAEIEYRQLLADKSTDSIPALHEKLLTALIQQGKYAEARVYLKKIPSAQYTPALWLRNAIVCFLDEQKEAGEKHLAQVNLNALASRDRPWYYLAAGLLADSAGNKDEAAQYFQQAKIASTTDAQRNHIEATIAREQVIFGQADSDLASTLKQKIAHCRDRKTAAEFVKQYAIVLNKLGQRKEAIKVIDKELKTAKGNDTVDQLLFVKGLLAGPTDAVGQQAFKEMILRKKNPELSALAVQLLAQAATTDKTISDNTLTALIDNLGNNPLVSPLLIARARAEILGKRFDLAERDVKKVLDDIPNSTSRNQALWLAAYLAWRAEPPRYRMAANYLELLQTLHLPTEEKFQANWMRIGCYYCAGDYELAGTLCNTLMRDATDHLRQQSEMLTLSAMCAIKMAQFDAAEKIIHAAHEAWQIDDRCAVEYALAYARKQAHAPTQAIQRLSELLKRNLPDVWRMRVTILLAQMQIEGKHATAAQTLLNQIPTLDANDKDNEALIALVYLLQSEAHFMTGKNEDALEKIKLLRQHYPQTEAAVRSYFDEAHYYASVNRHVDAQQCLTLLADTYPHHEAAPIALYEASVHSDACGSDRITQSIALLERLIQQYPNSAMIGTVKLRQAALLRKLCYFSAAEQIYTSILTSSAADTTKHLASLGRAQTILAQADEGAKKRHAQAVLDLEKLTRLQNVDEDVRAQSLFLMGYATKNDSAKAQQIFWDIVNRYILNPQAKPTGAAINYWAARAAFELGDLLLSAKNVIEAQRAYELIVDANLPGKALAVSKINALTTVQK